MEHLIEGYRIYREKRWPELRALHRRLAEHAMRELCNIMPWPKQGSTATEILPGGDFGAAGLAAYEEELKERFPWLPAHQINRYVRQFGTRSDALLAGVNRLDALGLHFGADLYQREVDFLVETEWAETADDIIWRRSKLGLRLSHEEIERLRLYLEMSDGEK